MDTSTDTTRSHLYEEGAAFALLQGDEPPAGLHGGDGDHPDVIVIGAGQAGLSVGYHLARHGLRFLILDGNRRIGDSWRTRWDSLRLFTPARYNSLDGTPFPADPDSFPTKDEMADYLEAYAAEHDLPVRTGTRVERVHRDGDGYVVTAEGRELRAGQVVVAMANYQRPKRPEFAGELRSDIVQIHSSRYRNPSQLAEGDVLVVGAGNSGAEIAAELARSHRVVIAGRRTGELPFKPSSLFGRLLGVRLVLRFVFHRVLTIRNAIGRKIHPKVTGRGGPLIRTRLADLAKAGVEHVGRVAGVRDGLPVLEDGRTIDAANVVWCTGFHPGFSWIDLPVFDERGYPRHEGGVVADAPGLYFVGLHFLYSLSSAMVHGVGRDARRIADAIAERASGRRAVAGELTAAS